MARSQSPPKKPQSLKRTAERRSEELFEKIIAFRDEDVFRPGGLPRIGMIPLAWVKPFLDRDLFGVCETARKLEDEWAALTAGEVLKPIMGEYEFFCGSPWEPAKKFQVTDSRTWGDEVHVEVELRWAPGGENNNLRYRVWLHWHEEDGQLKLAEILHPGSRLSEEIEKVSIEYRTMLDQLKRPK